MRFWQYYFTFYAFLETGQQILFVFLWSDALLPASINCAVLGGAVAMGLIQSTRLNQILNSNGNRMYMCTYV